MFGSIMGVAPTALVTGAARGIGLATAGELARAGHAVMLTDRDEAVHASADLLRYEVGPRSSISSTVLDVSQEVSVASAIEQTVEEFGPPLVLINNAAVCPDTETLETGTDQWDQVLATNLTGPFRCSRAVLPAMRDAKFGRIVMISSLTSKSAPITVNNASYSASKAGLVGLMHALAAEFASDGITVNAVTPGIVETELLRTSRGGGQVSSLRSRVPTGRFTTPDEVAATVGFLVSANASSITGELVNVNGGLHFA